MNKHQSETIEIIINNAIIISRFNVIPDSSNSIKQFDAFLYNIFDYTRSKHRKIYRHLIKFI